MLRKLLLLWVVMAGGVFASNPSPISAGEPASAGEPLMRQFQVLVQEGPGWHLHSAYPLQNDARQTAMRLWKEGKRVLIREVLVAPKK